MQPSLLRRIWTLLFLIASTAFVAIFACAPAVAFAGTSTVAATPSLDVGAAAVAGHNWPVLFGWVLGFIIWAYQRFGGEKILPHNVAEWIGHTLSGLTPASIVLLKGEGWAVAAQAFVFGVGPSIMAWRTSPRHAPSGGGSDKLPIDPAALRDSPVSRPPPSAPGVKREAALAEARSRFQAARLVRAARRAMPLLTVVLLACLLASCASLNQPVPLPPGCDPTTPETCPWGDAPLMKGRRLVELKPGFFALALSPTCQHDDDQQRTWGAVEVGGAAGAVLGGAIGGFGQINGSSGAKTAAIVGAIVGAVAGGVTGVSHYERDSWLERWSLDQCPSRAAGP